MQVATKYLSLSSVAATTASITTTMTKPTSRFILRQNRNYGISRYNFILWNRSDAAYATIRGCRRRIWSSQHVETRRCYGTGGDSNIDASEKSSSNGAATEKHHATPRHRFLLFLGPPGSGKGTQSHLLTQQLNHASQKQEPEKLTSLPDSVFISISAGDVLRREAKTNSELRDILARGEFAPEELTRHLMEQNVKNLVEKYSGHHGDEDDATAATETSPVTIILDGYPRTPYQLTYILSKWHDSVHLNAHNTTIFELMVSNESVMERLQGRYIHVDSGRTYHEKWKKPKKDLLDDVTGEPLTKREDDSHPDTIKRRLQNYYQVSKPMTHTLLSHGFQIVSIPEGSIEEVHKNISLKLEEL